MSVMQPKRQTTVLRAIAACAVISLSACAPMIPAETAHFVQLPAGAGAPPLQLRSQVDLKLSTAYRRSLPSGSRWRAVGSLPQGTVYQRLDDVFTIEGRQVHEAYLVVQHSALQGFYLPAEAQFSPLTPSVSLPLGAP